jgi:hypothetical protein
MSLFPKEFQWSLRFDCTYLVGCIVFPKSFLFLLAYQLVFYTIKFPFLKVYLALALEVLFQCNQASTLHIIFRDGQKSVQFGFPLPIHV